MTKTEEEAVAKFAFARRRDLEPLFRQINKLRIRAFHCTHGCVECPSCAERGRLTVEVLNEAETTLKKTLDSFDHHQNWWATRSDRLRQWVHDEVRPISETLATRFFNIVANGTPSAADPATYAQRMNILEHRLEASETECDKLRAEVAQLRAMTIDARLSALAFKTLESARRQIESLQEEIAQLRRPP